MLFIVSGGTSIIIRRIGGGGKTFFRGARPSKSHRFWPLCTEKLSFFSWLHSKLGEGGGGQDYSLFYFVWLCVVFKQSFRGVLLNYTEFSHSISPCGSEKYYSTFWYKSHSMLEKKTAAGRWCRGTFNLIWCILFQINTSIFLRWPLHYQHLQSFSPVKFMHQWRKLQPLIPDFLQHVLIGAMPVMMRVFLMTECL